jgi:hypothetical protein
VWALVWRGLQINSFHHECQHAWCGEVQVW